MVVVGRSYGQRGDDGEPRSAVRAADERVPVAAVAGIGQLGQAVVAGGHVRRGEGAAGVVRDAVADHESAAAAKCHRLGVDLLHDGQRRRAGGQFAPELGEPVRRSLDFDDDAVAVVDHETGQFQPGGQHVHERAEPDALHQPPHQDPVAFACRRNGRRPRGRRRRRPVDGGGHRSAPSVPSCPCPSSCRPDMARSAPS